MRPRTVTAVIAALGMLAVALPAAAEAQGVAWTACPSQAGVQCGVVTVPLDRTGAVPGTVGLEARRVPATAGSSGNAIVALAGGPGQSAAPLTSMFASLLAPARANRDLLVFDQRGTGQSGRLSCGALSAVSTANSLTEAGEMCANQLGAKRADFRTIDSVQDIEALRVAGGYQKLTLFGVSYGTKVALEYAAAYPANVERLVLDSVVAPEGPDALQRSTFAAIPRVLRELCSANACSHVTNDPVAALGALRSRLARRAITTRWTNDRGTSERVRITRADLLSVLMKGDLNPALRAEVPAALGSWRRGDLRPIARLAARAGGLVNLQGAGDEITVPLYASTLCEEGTFPWQRGSPVAQHGVQANAAVRALPPSVFAPFDASTALGSEVLSLCLRWPVASAAPAPTGPFPAVPSLILSGAADLRTPNEDAVALAARLPQPPAVVTVPWTGHSVLGSDLSTQKCATRALAQFFADQPVSQCTPEADPIAIAIRAPTSLGASRSVKGLRGRLGRTVAAVLDTVTDARREVLVLSLENSARPTRVGGLRGGYVSVAAHGLRLRATRYIPGVRVSGSAPDSGTITLTVHGGGALSGNVRINAAATRLSGRLGGRRFSITRAAGASVTADLPTSAQILRSFRPVGG